MCMRYTPIKLSQSNQIQKRHGGFRVSTTLNMSSLQESVAIMYPCDCMSTYISLRCMDLQKTPIPSRHASLGINTDTSLILLSSHSS